MSIDPWHLGPRHRLDSNRRKPLSETRWKRGDVVQIKRFGPHRDAYAQVLHVRIVESSLSYIVRIFFSHSRLIVDDLKTHELVEGDVDPLTFLALQALPDEPEKGKNQT